MLGTNESGQSVVSRAVLNFPPTDPTPIFELFRGNYATELLTAAVTHFNLFGRMESGPVSFDDLRNQLGLAVRPAHVLLTGMRAMGLLVAGMDGRLDLTPLAREHLIQGTAFDITGYIGMAGQTPGVQAMVERLVTNRPAGMKPAEAGAAFIFRDGMESAMEREASARTLTLALAGRAKNVAPYLAERIDLGGCQCMLDVAGGTGIYSIAWLQRHPELRAIVFDRPEVLKIAAEMAATYGVADRLQCVAGDMFADPLPSADVILLSNVLHDWDVPQCRILLERCAQCLPSNGRLLLHDVFLNDDLGGPLSVALYSAALFSVTEGRAYSAAEYREWMTAAGLACEPILPTLVHCGVMPARKP